MADITITLRDTPSGTVAIHSTFAPAIGQRNTPAQSLALDLQREALHRAGVEVDVVGVSEGGAA